MLPNAIFTVEVACASLETVAEVNSIPPSSSLKKKSYVVPPASASLLNVVAATAPFAAVTVDSASSIPTA
jgi:hypothetical protein